MDIAIALYDRFTALDCVGPYDVLSRLPGARVHWLAVKPGPVRADAGLIVQAQAAFSDLPEPDVLLVPGGMRFPSQDEDPELLGWIASAHEHTTWTTSVCTGSLALGAAGILEGVAATSHWAAIDALSQYGAVPTTDRVVFAGKIATAAGVSAGIDLALALAARIADRDTAEAIQLGIEYAPEPPFDSGDADSASDEVRQRALEALLASQ
jgi:transcriptional regulator GlxA family with amidase domain